MQAGVAYSIKRIVDEKGFRQGAIAVKSGFSEQQFSDMLNGRKTIKAEYIPRIAAALGVDPNAIYENYSE